MKELLRKWVRTVHSLRNEILHVSTYITGRLFQNCYKFHPMIPVFYVKGEAAIQTTGHSVNILEKSFPFKCMGKWRGMLHQY